MTTTARPAAAERRRAVYPRTAGEIWAVLAPWLALYAAFMLVQWLLVLLLPDMNILRLTEDSRSVFRRNGDTRTVDGLFSVVTLMLNAMGIGASILTASLPFLRRDDRRFAAAISFQFGLLAVEEQLTLHELVHGIAGEVAVLAIHVLIAVAIVVAWPRRVLRVWPLIVVAGGALGSAIVLDSFNLDLRIWMYVEEWLELLGAVFLCAFAVMLARQTLVEASMARRRLPPEPTPAASGVSPPRSG